MRVRAWRIAGAGLLPYAAASTAVLVVSALALGTTLRDGAPSAVTPPSPLASRARLSDTGRLAYWRTGASGKLELWVGDLDGGRRWSIATASEGTEVSLTHWSRDGTAVAFSLGGSALGVAHVDGGVAVIPIPAALRADRRSIRSLEWSPDGARVAATLGSAPFAGESDVYVVETRAGALWKRATTIGDAFAGQWIDDDRLFVETAAGVIAVLDLATDGVRPLTGMQAVSPTIGRDGRVYFVGGAGMPPVGAAPLPYASGWVWSATIDGDDLRREEKAPHDQMRLLGVLADGRAVVGVPGSIYVAGDDLIPLPYRAGNVRRVVVSQDGRRLIALADPRIVRVDPSKIPRRLTDDAAPATATTVLLDGVRAADAWLPAKAVELEHAPPAGGTRPPEARLAFTLGGVVWESRPGEAPRPVISAGAAGGSVGFLSWSPAGDALAATVQVAGALSPAQTVVVRRSEERRWTVGGFIRAVSWSPDGSRIAVTAGGSGRGPDEPTVQVYDADSGTPRERIASATASWTPLGMVLLTSGDLAPGVPLRTGERIELLAAGERRTVTTAARLAADPLLAELGGADLPAAITRVVPSADGGLLAVSVSRLTRSGAAANSGIAVIRTADGTPLWASSFGSTPLPQDLGWSPRGTLLAWTVHPSTGMPSASPVARVTDGLLGRTVLERGGRAGGWSPDGAWMYVARVDGLFAAAADGTADVRVGPVGVPVVATAP